MLPSKKIITLGIFCFVTILLLAGIVISNGQSKVTGKIVVVEDKGISLNKEETIPLESVVEDDEKTISAESFLAVLVKKDGTEEILIEKNKKMNMPIASLSKLMTALIAMEKYSAEDVVTISETSLQSKATSTLYRVGDSFYFSDILKPLLLASHNEIASVLAEKIGDGKFVGMMNARVQKLGLKDTFFVNVTGLDTATSTDKINSSTASDMVGLLRYLQKNYPEILLLTGQKEADLFDVNKKIIAKITNTNRLVGQSDLPFRILAGKTGETPRAKQSLVIVVEAPCKEKIIAVVLGSQDRFGDMQKILQYVKGQIESDCRI